MTERLHRTKPVENFSCFLFGKDMALSSTEVSTDTARIKASIPSGGANANKIHMVNIFRRPADAYPGQL